MCPTGCISQLYVSYYCNRQCTYLCLIYVTLFVREVTNLWNSHFISQTLFLPIMLQKVWQNLWLTLMECDFIHTLCWSAAYNSEFSLIQRLHRYVYNVRCQWTFSEFFVFTFWLYLVRISEVFTYSVISKHLKGFFSDVQIRDYVLSLFCVCHSYLNVTRTSYVLWTYPNIPELRICWIL